METTVRLAAVARVRKKDRLKLGAFPTHASDMHRVMAVYEVKPPAIPRIAAITIAGIDCCWSAYA
jgi:hypothetical protein